MGSSCPVFQSLAEDLLELMRLNRERERLQKPDGIIVSPQDLRKLSKRISVLRERLTNPTPRQSLYGSRRGRLPQHQRELIDAMDCLNRISNLLD